MNRGDCIMRGTAYKFALVSLSVFGGVVVLVSMIVAVHDSAEYRALPEQYRAGIEKLQKGWGFYNLHVLEQAAILDRHERWVNEKKLQWWWAGSTLVDPELQKAGTLSNFEKFVPRWGLRIHQQRPILAVLVSLVAFVPLVLLVGWAKAPQVVPPMWLTMKERLTSMKDKITLFHVIAGVALLFVVFVWPTPYRYEKVSQPRRYGSGSYQSICRINRVTGTMERLSSRYDSWQDGAWTAVSYGVMTVGGVVVIFLVQHSLNRDREG